MHETGASFETGHRCDQVVDERDVGVAHLLFGRAPAAAHVDDHVGVMCGERPADLGGVARDDVEGNDTGGGDVVHGGPGHADDIVAGGRERGADVAAEVARRPDDDAVVAVGGGGFLLHMCGPIPNDDGQGGCVLRRRRWAEAPVPWLVRGWGRPCRAPR